VTRDPRLADPRGIGPGLTVSLVVLVMLDQVLALGTIGQNPAGTLSRGDVPLGPRVVGGAVAALTLSGFLLVARAVWLRSARARRNVWVMITTVVTGTTAGLAVGRRVLAARTPEIATLQVAFDETALVAGLTLALIVVLGLIGRHRDAVVELQARSMQLEVALTSGERELRAERERLQAQVRSLLESRLGPAAVGGSAFTADRLRTIAVEVLRPLSHRLADTRTGFEPTAWPSDSPAPNWRVLRDLRPEPVVRPRLLTVIMVLLTFRLGLTFVTPTDEPAWPALPQSGVTVTVDWSSLSSSLLLHAVTLVGVLVGTRLLARVLARRLTAAPSPTGLVTRWMLTVGALVALGVFIFSVIRLAHLLPLFGPLTPVTPAMLLGFTMPLVLVTVAVSTFEAAETALTSVTAAMERANSDLARAAARTNALLTHERRTFARQLHASVQAAVNAGSLVLERAEAEGTLDHAVIARVAQRIERAVSGLESAAEEADLRTRLAETTTAFEDLAAITVEVDGLTLERLDGDATARATISDVIIEACANAVLHGRASTVAVRIGPAEGAAVELEVVDDGIPQPGADGVGLGTRVLETACTAWSIEHRADGTTLSATMPVR